MEALPKHVRRHGPGFRAVINLGGRRHVGPAYPTPEEASEWAANFKAAKLPKKVLTIQDAFDALLQELADKESAPDTIAYYQAHFLSITQRAAGWSPDLPLHRITPDQVQRYARKRKEAGVSTSTIWGKDLQVMTRLLNLAVRIGALPSNPLKSVPRPKVRQNRYAYLPKSTILNLVRSMREWGGTPAVDTREYDADVVEFFFYTGMRRSEVARLTIVDVDLGRNTIWVRGKNANRYIPIMDGCAEPLRRILLRAKKGEGLIGVAQCISTLFVRWGRRLGEPRLTAHTLRHSFGTAMADAGVHVLELMSLMGHTNPQQTARYYHGRLAAGDRGALDLRRPDAADRRAVRPDPGHPRTGRASR